MYGWTGKMLEVNLSTRNSAILRSSVYNNRFIGGRGVGDWILFNEVKPDTLPLDPGNVMIFGTGPLTGTAAPSSGRLSLVTKNVLSGGIVFSNGGGHFAPELKYAGFDHITISGKASSPVYLFIDYGKVEIKDASFMWGKDVWESEDAIKEELKDNRVQVLSIGPAGENLVKSACIIVNKGRALGFGGCGAVMGSKNLKAIVVRGNRSVAVADPSGFIEECQENLKKMNRSLGTKFLRKGGTINKIGPLFPQPVRNYQDGNWGKRSSKVTEIAFKKLGEKRRLACFNCPINCSHYYSIEEGPYAGLNCEGLQINAVRGFGSNLDIPDPGFILECNALCNKMGLHIDEVSASLSWAFECFEKKILTKKDTDGLELEWGRKEVVIELIKKMAYRDGFGNILAEGVQRAAQIVGEDSKKYAMYIKGTGVNEGNMRAKKAWALGIVTSTRGGGHLCGSPNSEGVKSVTPEIGQNRYGVPTAGDSVTYRGKAKLVVWFEKYKALVDSLGICYFTSYWQNNLLGPEEYARLFSKATGKAFNADDLFKIGQQILNIEKAFNTLHTGYSRKDDFPPDRLMNEPVKSGPHKGERLEKSCWNDLLDRYYTLQGWDMKTGWQTDKCLSDLSLNEVRIKLEKAGRLIKND